MPQDDNPDEIAPQGEVLESLKAAPHTDKANMEEEHYEEHNTAHARLAASMVNRPTDKPADMDVLMSDGTPNRPASPAVFPSANVGIESPAPHRVSTPLRTNGNADVTSRATSQHPEPASAQAFPKQAALHGAPTRQYLNSKVTTVVMEGMKQIAKDQPADPLRVLGEYLLQKSKELEGT